MMHPTSMDREPAPTWDLSVQVPSPQPHASDMWWQSLETCSNCLFQDPPPTYTPTYADIWWLLKHDGQHKRAVHPTGMLSCPLFTYANFWREIQPQLTNKKLIKFPLNSLLLSKNKDECNDFHLWCQTHPRNSTSNSGK